MKKDLYLFKDKKISSSLTQNMNFFKELYKKDSVFRLREIEREKGINFKAAILFMDGMVNVQLLNDSVIRPLLTVGGIRGDHNITDYIEKQVLFTNEAEKTDNILKMLEAIAYGDTVIILDGSEVAIIVNTKGWRTRGISEPTDERVLQGPREGFDEAIMMNVAMLRRKLPTPDLCVELIKSGRKSDTRMFLCYLDSVVKPEIINVVKKRIESINIDAILDSNYINELINENEISLFKTAGSSERPDIVAARILEGRIALIVDGTPVVLTFPYLFTENFQSDDDYYLNYLFAGFGRVLRYLCFYLSICIPALYVALTVYHPKLLPASFMITVSSSRGGLPFPTFLECLLLIVIFEILRETGIRMQQSVGHALSIVGGLVVGQAAVEAKIISAPLLIVVALSGISGLMVPRLKTAVIFCKIILALSASLLGLYGFFAAFTLIHYHIYSLDSFGIDYAGGATFKNFKEIKDTIIRAPWFSMYTRPGQLTDNITRMTKKK